jgi:hypothetical protein
VQVLEQITGRKIPQVLVAVFESCFQWESFRWWWKAPEVGLLRQVWCEEGEPHCAAGFIGRILFVGAFESCSLLVVNSFGWDIGMLIFMPA